VAESGGLENRCAREGTVGSNPTPSARCHNRSALDVQALLPAPIQSGFE